MLQRVPGPLARPSRGLHALKRSPIPPYRHAPVLHIRHAHTDAQPSRPWRFLTRTIRWSLIGCGALTFSAVFAVGSLLLWDASTYREKHFARPQVPDFAIDPPRGGPKNLKIVAHYLDDADSDESRSIQDKPRLVIIGGGWGGISILKHLTPGQYNVTVLSPTNYTLFTPLLPSACVGTVEIRSLVEGLRRLVNRIRGHVLSVEAVDIEVEDRLIECKIPNSDGEHFYVPYDKAIVAVGSTTNTFGVPGTEHSFQLKSVQDVLGIRKKIISNLEAAALPTTSEEERKRLLSVVVCGGGPTGVEFASEVIDVLNEDVAQRFPKLLSADAKVSIIQSRDHILNTYSEQISEYAEKKFRKDRIDTILNARVKEVTPDGVIYTYKDKSKGKSNVENPPSEHKLSAGLVLWSTGVGMRPFTKNVASRLPNQYHHHALQVDSQLRVTGAPPGTLYAIGDASTVETDLQKYLYELVAKVDSDKDNRINLQEFERMVKELTRKFPMAREHVAKAHKLFSEWDVNNDSSLDLNELSASFGKLSKRITSYPATAQVASQEGSYLGKKLNQLSESYHAKLKSRDNGDSIDEDSLYDPFIYKHLGSLAYIGNSAVFDFAGYSFTGGLIAMYLWRSIYWSEQVSMRTRFALMVDWIKRGVFGRDMSGFA